MLNISRGRVSNQIRYARALRERLPAVAKAFATGVIDFRMILTIIARTENVDDEVVPQLDEALARHVAKWMRFSEPKLRDRLDLWAAKFDPAAVRIPPKVDEDRFVQIQPDGPGMGLIWGSIHAPTPQRLPSGWMPWWPAYARRIRAPPSNAVPMPAGRWRGKRHGWPARPTHLRCTGRGVRR